MDKRKDVMKVTPSIKPLRNAEIEEHPSLSDDFKARA